MLWSNTLYYTLNLLLSFVYFGTCIVTDCSTLFHGLSKMTILYVALLCVVLLKCNKKEKVVFAVLLFLSIMLNHR